MEEGKKRLATMVGCNYAGTRYELHGCINDVEAMHDALISRFSFLPENISVLTDAAGSALLPTGVNVKRALADMIGRAEAGDVLFFHYSGHGTLIPAVKRRHGRSGRDEAIVPCDFNLITDVDFRELVDRLPAGASFTMISDSCHSGGLIDKEKEQIGPSTFSPTSATLRRRPRAIPFDSLMTHLASLSTLDSPHVADHLVHLFGPDASSKFSKTPKSPDSSAAAGDAGILLSGCQTDETSADMSPGDAGIGGKSYGAFSNAIQVVLREEEREIGNRELVMKARGVLREQRFMQQHPCLYCSDVNANAPFLWQSISKSKGKSKM